MIDSNFLTWVRVRFSNVGFIDNLEHAYIANEGIFLSFGQWEKYRNLDIQTRMLFEQYPDLENCFLQLRLEVEINS